MAYRIRKVAVLGAGVMGAQIACHFANIGIEVLLLDQAPKELNEKEKQMNLSLDQPKVRNRIVTELFDKIIRLKPSPLYLKKYSKRICPGNFEDDLSKISDCDWIIEAIIENLEIKQNLYQQIEKYRKSDAIVSSNTSGIPIELLIQGRSENFASHFCGTHFFNPPRYLKLLEIIPSSKTSHHLIDFLTDFGERFLGKSVVICKDTPAFIANRVGMYAMMSVLHLSHEFGFSVEEIDRLTGPIIGRAKSATFRTCDVVGLDTLSFVAQNLQKALPDDEANHMFQLPEFLQKMLQKDYLGAKTGKGFYQKIKEKGQSIIQSIHFTTLEYQQQKKVKFPELDAAKAIPDVKDRIAFLLKGKSKVNQFYQKLFFGLFAYVSNRIPEISDEIYKIDEAICSGFAWEIGPFEIWNAIGIEKTNEAIQKNGFSTAEWLSDFTAEKLSFYQIKNGKKEYYNLQSKTYLPIPGSENTLDLDHLRIENTLWKNEDCSIINLGDGVINLEFHSKMNTLGGEIIQGINKAVDLCEKDHKALIISNQGENFSAGANLGLVFMLAIEQELEELDLVVRTFQKSMLKLKYAPFPVIVAPHGLCLGGACELSMHSDKIIAHAETYMGLVELGVGVIPAGGGSKEFAMRLSNEIQKDDIRTNLFREKFLTIGQAKVSTSAYEAFDLGYLRKEVDEVIVSRKHQLAYAKKSALLLLEKGYLPPLPDKEILVLGKEAMGLVYSGAHGMKTGHYISEYDEHLSVELGKVLSGGELSEPTFVSEEYLLDLERIAFVKLCQQRKTLERMQSLLQKGKILRN
jgi:3-hydroxyacyl-CoA dehydrogenase